MDTEAFIQGLTASPNYEGQISHVEHLSSRSARYGELEKPLDARVLTVLKERGLYPLYAHQAQAVNLARQGKNVMVATPSASGKTMCYNIPVVETLLKERLRSALYLFPTK